MRFVVCFTNNFLLLQRLFRSTSLTRCGCCRCCLFVCAFSEEIVCLEVVCMFSCWFIEMIFSRSLTHDYSQILPSLPSRSQLSSPNPSNFQLLFHLLQKLCQRCVKLVNSFPIGITRWNFFGNESLSPTNSTEMRYKFMPSRNFLMAQMTNNFLYYIIFFAARTKAISNEGKTTYSGVPQTLCIRKRNEERKNELPRENGE